MLSQKSRTRLQILCLPQCSRFYRNGRSDRIAIALNSAQAEGDRVANILHPVMKNPHLRSVAVFQDELQTAVMIKISENKRAAVLRKIQSKSARNFRECTIAVVRESYISFIATPGVIRSNQFVESIPSMLVSQRGRCVVRGFCYNLPPEKAAEVIPRLTLRSGAEMYPLAT